MAVDPEAVVQLIRQESVLVDREGLVALYEAVHKMAGFGLGGILYAAGKKGGEQGARTLRERLGLEGEDLLQAARIAFNTSGWGTMEFLDEGRIQVRDSALAGRIRSRKPVCHPLAGYIAGFLEAAWGKKVKVKEVACAASGAEACLFEVEA